MSLPCHRAVAACMLAAALLAACGGSFDDDVPFAFSATLAGADQLPVTSGAASGVGLVTVDPDGRTLTASLVLNGIADTDAHIHQSVPGAAGPVSFPLARTGQGLWTTRAPLTPAQFDELRNGNFYFEAHGPTAAADLRGQIVWVMPSDEQLLRLIPFRQQSATVDLQLRQVEEIRHWDDWRFTGIGFGLTIGF